MSPTYPYKTLWFLFNDILTQYIIMVLIDFQLNQFDLRGHLEKIGVPMWNGILFSGRTKLEAKEKTISYWSCFI